MEANFKSNLAEPKSIAEYLGTTTGNLAQLRYKGAGPRFIKLGHRAIRYKWSDVEAWIEANTLSQSDQDFEPKTAA